MQFPDKRHVLFITLLLANCFLLKARVSQDSNVDTKFLR